MGQTKHLVSVDSGGSGGKMMLSALQGGVLTVEEILPFSNLPVLRDGQILVDHAALMDSLVEGLRRFAARCRLDSIGIDTWGGSYAWISDSNELLAPVYNCRSNRQHELYYRTAAQCDTEKLFRHSGVLFERHTFLSQLFYETQNGLNPSGGRFLAYPSFLVNQLTGSRVQDLSTALDSCLLNVSDLQWNEQAMQEFSLSEDLFLPVVPVGTPAGAVSESRYTGEPFFGTPVVHVAGHDTVNAIAAIPDFREDDVFVSIGTTIIVGAQSKRPVVSEAAYRSDFKNCIGLWNQYYLCTDITGFWIANQCLDHFSVNGRPATITDMISEAGKADPVTPVIDVNDPRFGGVVGDMPLLVRSICEENGEHLDMSLGGIGRCLFNSYASAIETSIKNLSGVLDLKKIRRVNIISGAVRNELLMQIIADKLKMPVSAGIPYATLVGNTYIQLAGAGLLASPDELSHLASESFPMKQYCPVQSI